MIGRLYTLSVANEQQTAAVTLMEITCPADAIATIERIYITQSSFDTSENLGSTTQRVSTTGTGTATTLRPVEVGSPAAGVTAKTNMSAEPTYDANGILLELGFNVLSGLLWTPANEDELLTLSPSGIVGINLDVAPSGAMNFSYGCTVREAGG